MIALLAFIWVGGMAVALAILGGNHIGEGSCTGDCDQGRNCTCGGHRDARVED